MLPMLPKKSQSLEVCSSNTTSGSIVSWIPVSLLWVIIPTHSKGPDTDSEENAAIPQSVAEL